MKILEDFGKREALVYIVVFLWITMGIFAFWKGTDLEELSIYFGSLTTYVATYIWAESKRPSEKTGILKPGLKSRREIMIYIIVFIWTVAGSLAIWFGSDFTQLSVYFFSLTGFITSWIAGESYKPQHRINKI